MSEGIKWTERLWARGLFARAWKPVPVESIVDWAERTLRIPEEENDELAGQLWSSEVTPHVRWVMEWVRGPGKSELFIRKSSQTGITMAVIIIILWMMEHEPRNVLYVVDSAEEAKRISKVRLKNWIKKNRMLEGGGVSEDDLSNLTYYLKGMTVYLGGSFAKGLFRNKAVSLAFLDELDAHGEWEDGKTTIQGTRSRLKRHKQSKLLAFSTPTDEMGSIHVEYEAGTKERLQVTCCHCELPQFLDWKQVIYSDPEFLMELEGLTPEEVPDRERFDLEYVRRNAYYRCESGCRISDADRRKMLRTQVPVSTAKKGRNQRRRSLWISDLYSTFVSLGELSVEWIEAQGDMRAIAAFKTERMGEPNRRLIGKVEEGHFRRLRMNYARGECPVRPLEVNGAYFVVMVVDVQLHTYKWVKMSFTRTGAMFVADWGEVSTLSEVQDEANRPVLLRDGTECAVYYGVMDGSDGKKLTEVIEFCHGVEWCRDRELQHWVSVKGFARRQMNGPFRVGHAVHEGVKVVQYHIQHEAWVSFLLLEMIGKARERRDNGAEFVALPRNIEQRLVDELMAEELRPVKDKYDENRKEWVKKSSQANDWLDCFKYGAALWSILSHSWLTLEPEEEGCDAEYVDD